MMQTIALPSQCDRKAAIALYPELLEAVDNERVRIKADKVERMGLAMLQLLLAARQSHCGIELAEPSEAVRAALELCGDRSLLEGDAA